MSAATSPGSETTPEVPLLERELCLETLRDAFRSSVQGSGRLVLVSGEAGVGKTAIVRAFCDTVRNEARVLEGSCDALFTPRPLGPLADVAAVTGEPLASLVAGAARPHEVFEALVAELHGRRTVLVLEDLHLADEATLDVLQLLARRLEAVGSLVVATYRDDELDDAAALRLVLGGLATSPGVTRVSLDPLSLDAVRVLAEPAGVDAADLHRSTGGNPFFVTETLGAPGDTLPPTVRDAVFARAARLSVEARRLLDAVAVQPARAELWLLEQIAAGELDHLDECLASGMLEDAGAAVAFRHELGRLAVETSISRHRRRALHAATLAALAGAPVPEPARLAHHAEAADDAEAVLSYAPAAGDRAAELGSHREAAAQYGRALAYGDRLSVEERGELLERRSYECYLTGQFAEAIEAERRALDCHRRRGDRRAEGDSLRSLSRLLRYVGRTRDAADAGRQAVAVLDQLPPGRELALAYCHMSHSYVWAEDADAALDWALRARELAERIGDREAFVYALTNIGASESLVGVSDGRQKFERSFELARDAELEDHAGRALVNIVWWAPRDRSYSAADRYLDDALEYCVEHGLDLWRLYLLAYRARSELDQGRWSSAVMSAGVVLRDPRATPVPRIWALAVLGVVRARRGDPEVWRPLDAAWALAEPTEELQRIAPVAEARAEAAWLEGRSDLVDEASSGALDLAVRRKSPWVSGALTSWRRRAGLGGEVPGDSAPPYAAQIEGDWSRASTLWDELGCPYEAALALGEANEEEPLRQALDRLQGLGARPATALVARRLRERGARRVSRGPRTSTRRNPGGLTRRELEVLQLLAAGLRNAEIAERLFLSTRTVEHHVGAIMRKLEAATRGEAVAAAQRLRVLEDR